MSEYGERREREPSEPTLPNRGHNLTVVQRRFTRRWVLGVLIGVALVGVNWFGFHATLQRFAGEVDHVPSVRSELDRMHLMNSLLAVMALVVLGALAFAFFRPLDRTLRSEARKIDRIETNQAEETERRRFDAELHEALEMATDERAVQLLVRRVLEHTVPDNPAELLLADSSEAHLAVRAENPTAGAAGCTVTSPFDCPAVRRARPVTFASSTAVNACPHLGDRPGEPRSAHCVPLAFMGRSMGVLHMTGPDGQPPDEPTASRMASVANQVGNHLGTVRGFATAQIQASTDSLTGLPNRRSVEDELSRRLAQGEAFAVAIADLDNFKLLNDAHGHEAGDRALRLFAETVRKALRTEDLFARWGGEEFVIALPGMRRDAVVDVLDRARLALVDACARAETPPITASFGVVDTTVDRTLDVLLRSADEGLSIAKRSGKDQVQVGPAQGQGPRSDDLAVAGDQPSKTTVLRP